MRVSVCLTHVGATRARWLLLGLIAAGPSAGQAAARPWFLMPPNTVAHVIHISFDGLGGLYLQDYVSRAPGEFPAFARLVREGAATFNARCDPHSSLTEPNHATILTGRPVWQQPTAVPWSAPHGLTWNHDPGPPYTLHNLGNQRVPYKASVFDVVHDHGLRTAFFAGKQKLGLFVRSYDALNGAPDAVAPDHGRAKIDQYAIVDWQALELTAVHSTYLVCLAAGALCSNQPPHYTFLHLVDPDIFGHYYGWDSEQYRTCIRRMDLYLTYLLAVVEANPVLAGRTALVITADHGGSGYDHSNPYLRPVYTIPMLLWCPGVPAGADLYSLLGNRADPGSSWLDYNAVPPPLWNGDSANIALALLGLPPIPGSCLIPEFRPVPVSLSISRTATGLTVSWPETGEGYWLEWSGVCGGSAWELVDESIPVVNGRRTYRLTAPLQPPMRFFRLVKLD